MKKLLVGIIGGLICQMGLAQQTKEMFHPELAFGVNAGVALSKVNFVPSFTPEVFLSQNVGGITIRYISEKNFGLQAELNYSLRGWKEKTDTVHPNNYSRSLAYIEFPLMTHVYFSMSRSTRVLFNIGPQVSYFIGEKDLERIIITVPERNYYDQKVQKSFDYGLTGGLGLELNTSIGSFILDGRYYFGLSNVFNSQKGDISQSSSNQVIGMKLTYIFHRR